VDYWIGIGTNPYINSNTRMGGYPRTLANEYRDLLNLGEIFNVEARAQAIVGAIQADVADALAKAAGGPAQEAAIIEFIDGQITNYGAATLAGDRAAQLGAALALPEARSISAEDLLNADPDVIFVVYMQYAGEDGEDVRQTQLGNLLGNPAYASLKAVANQRVYPIMLGDMYASAVRTGDGVRTLSAGLYPAQ
jgi:iron complex transport system substrate-binding protein